MFLLKVLFFAFVIYWAIKSIGRIFLPFLFNQASQKINNQQNFKQKKQGEVTIHYQDNKNKKSDKNIGEYIDYEDIKD